MFHRFRIMESYLKNIPFTSFPLNSSRSIRQVTCWKCGTENSTNLYCKSCNVLQEPDSKCNYFDLIGIPFSYDINTHDLVSKYHKKQILFHPDKHSNKSEKEKDISDNYSSLINKAYSTLSNPLKRGLYILTIKGSPIDEEKISTDDRDLFLEILELNDELESIKWKKQAMGMATKLNEIITKLIKEISLAFEKDDTERAKILLNRLKYYTTVLSKLKAKKQFLGYPD